METKKGKEDKKALKSIRSIKLSLPKALVLALLVSTVSGVLAAIMVSRQVNLSMVIRGTYSLEVRDIDHVTVLTAIDFGDMFRGETYKYPANPPTDTYWLVNDGDYPLWVSFSLSSFPSDVTFDIYARRGDQSAWTKLGPGDIFADPLNPDGETAQTSRIEWYIECVVDLYAAFSSYSPVLTWNGHDTSSG